ncbi:MAG TPA: ATP-binding protein [Solirubrobacteraceae bacterium]|jgi:signal transduction histidine kinase|nr:ATP-binding protein [Solirubrobacteraceae bacterium]
MSSENLEIPATIDRLLELIEASDIGSVVPPAVKAGAHARALELLDAGGAGEGAGAIALLTCAAEVLCEVAVDLAARPRDARALIEAIEAVAGVPSVALGREVLRTPSLPQLSSDVALEVQLALLLIFAGVDATSLWTLSPSGDLLHVSHAGALDLGSPRSSLAARSLLTDSQRVNRRSQAGIRLERWLHPVAALVAHGDPARADHRALLLDAAVPVIGSILERDELRAREQTSGESVVSSVERRLARVRFDLHDGPQQDVHLLAQDLRSFRDQLRPIVAQDANAARVLGRIDDFEAQLVALDGDLRRISTSVQSPFVHPGSVPERLRQITDAFAARAGFEPVSRLEGDLSALSDSQQIALMALIREALSNVREHSRARKVTISIASGPAGITAEVTDDGVGFDPETTLVRAAREGHLGLVGMHERVRMLGGRTHIESRPGGPTVISVSLPSWPSHAEGG